jgi:GH24 family phage-related lysozyme (muramidase)
MEIPPFNLISNIIQKDNLNKPINQNNNNDLPNLDFSLYDLFKSDNNISKKSNLEILPLNFSDGITDDLIPPSKPNNLKNQLLKKLDFETNNNQSLFSSLSFSNNQNIKTNNLELKPINKVNSMKVGNLNIPSIKTKVNGVDIFIEPKALQQIMRCETYVPPPGIDINDGAGVTVGYGHTATKCTIRNKQDAVNVLANDVKLAIQDKFKSIPREVLSKLNQDQLNALASVAMNLSSKGFREFAPVKALLQKDKSIEQRIDDASTAFMSKLRKGFKGLVWRRATESLTFAGIYVENPGKDALKLAQKNNLV